MITLGRVKLQIKGLNGADKAKFVVEGHIVRVAWICRRMV
jgi:hypothetical protein